MVFYKLEPLLVFILCCVALQARGELCAEGQSVEEYDVHNEEDPGVFDVLTSREIERVYRYMLDDSGLPIVPSDQATVNSSYIYLIERLSPAKAQVLANLDHGAHKPARYAKVILFRGDIVSPVVEVYKVGPLPGDISHERLLLSGRDNVEYIRRPHFNMVDMPAFDRLVSREMTKVGDIVEQTLGYRYETNCTKKCLRWITALPGEFKTGTKSMWAQIVRIHEGFYLHPVGLQLRMVAGSSLNPDDWTVDYVWFRGFSYSSFDEMAESFQAPPAAEPPVYTDDSRLYSSLNHRGQPLPHNKQRGPRSFMPDGRRYRVNGHQVEWQGWRFDFSMDTEVGLQVHDARFKGDRIVYELGLSELGVLYSGASPLPIHAAYVDSPFGKLTFELIAGVDCPEHATFFDSVHFLNYKPFIFTNNICVFEMNRNVPLRRHTSINYVNGYHWKQGMPGNVLVLRAALSVFNYEYIQDYIFHQNGALEVVVTLSGYILSSYYTGQPSDDRYGFQVAPDVLGQIHNHLCHFKVDLDILGQQNRFETLDIKIDDIPDPARPSERIKVQKFDRNLRHTEKQAAYQYNFDTPKYLVFHNNRTTNKYGNARGYRLLPLHVNKQLLPPEWTIEKGMSWARYQVAVTQYKDEEPRSSSVFNQPDNVDPVVNFQSFIDNDESIVDEDLVAWVSLGAFHIPHSEDIPIVQTPGLSLTFFLLPFNFFDEDPSLASRDNIRVEPTPDGSDQFSYVGVSPDITCQPHTTSISGAAKHHGWLYGIMLLTWVLTGY